MFTLAHLSDVHLPLMRRPAVRELLGKRASGYLNLVRARGANHQAWAVDAIMAAIAQAGPDHVALTGDLINISLHDEFPDALAWLRRFGPPDWISLVPGNHDAYVGLPDGHGLAVWQAYMRNDVPDHDTPGDPLHWPYLRRRGPVALIGVSTAIVTPPLKATGTIGKDQLARLKSLLQQTRDEGLCRIVLIHHPPEPVPTKWRKRLTDAHALAGIIAETGAELILHGHNHTDTLAFTPGAGGPVAIVGVPSASATGRDHRPEAQYNLFRIDGGNGAFFIEQTAHRLDVETRQFRQIYVRKLDAGHGCAAPPQPGPAIHGAV